jgi:hypothetical protein
MDTLTRRVRKTLLAIEGVVESGSIFGEGDGFWVNGTMIAHILDDGRMEIRPTKANISEHRAQLKADERIELRKSASDWLTVRWSSPKDVALIAELAEIAAAAHRAPEGVPTKPPPHGAELARRRRFH